jgi:hypothetical protein
MQKDLFRAISKGLEDHDDWFKLQRNAARKMSTSPLRIFHNMFIEDERGMLENFRYISNGDLIEPEHYSITVQKFLEMHRRIEKAACT